MSLKGKFGFFNGALSSDVAYAVVDHVSVDKGGYASCHISVYSGPPVDRVVQQEFLNAETKVVEPKDVTIRERGPVIEHFTVSGVLISSEDPFAASYKQIPTLDTRFKDMSAA
jgi:hypothetical protein